MKPILERRTIGEILELTTTPNEPINQEEARRNFKRLIMQYHPDRCKLPEAEEYTKRLNKAYAIATEKEMPPQQAVQPSPPQQPQVVIIRWGWGGSFTANGSTTIWY